MKHRTFWAIFILGVLLVSGFAGLLTLAAGAPGSNPARAPASDSHLTPATGVIVPPYLTAVGVSDSGSPPCGVVFSFSLAQNVTVGNYSVVFGTIPYTSATYFDFMGQSSLGVTTTATLGQLNFDTTYYLMVVGWSGDVPVVFSNVAVAHTPAAAPVVPVSLTIPQVVVISTFMALIVAGLIVAGTRNRGRPKRRGYPVED